MFLLFNFRNYRKIGLIAEAGGLHHSTCISNKGNQNGNLRLFNFKL